MKFGFGQPLTRKEDDPLLRGAGRYIADVSPGKAASGCHGALTARPCAIPDPRPRKSTGHAGRPAGVDGSGHFGLGPLPTPGVLAGRGHQGPGVSDPCKRRGAARGQCHCFRGRRQPRAGERCSGGIAVDWQECPTSIGAVAALKPGAPKVWADRPKTTSPLKPKQAMPRATKEAFAKAARVVVGCQQDHRWRHWLRRPRHT